MNINRCLRLRFLPFIFLLLWADVATADVTLVDCAGGDGSSCDPYQISTAAELNAIRDDLDAYYILTADIDLTDATGDPSGAFWDGGSGWEPIDSFTGSLDGDGHTITGLFINRPDEENVGLFGAVGSFGALTSMGMLDVYITGEDNVGGLAGSLDNSSITHSYTSGSVVGVDYIGGLVGKIIDGEVVDSYSTGIVSGNDYVGGLVGSLIESSITNSYSTGSSSVGGLVGESLFGIVADSYWNTETSGQADGVGHDGDDSGITGLTSAQMRQQASFSGFDFTNTWQIEENLSFPVLQENTQDPAPGLIFDDGDGSDGDPWHISTAEQLNAVRENLNSHYIQMANIDLSDATGDATGAYWNSGSGWDPIGDNAGHALTGGIDGNGFTITGLFIDRDGEDNVGLFGYVGTGAHVEQIQLLNVDVTGRDETGGLAGRHTSALTISNSSTTGSVSGRDLVGGLVGNNSGSISGSYSTATVNGNEYLGGLLGQNEGTVTESYAIGNVSGTNVLGGLVGANNFGSITDSYTTGSVSGAEIIGGLTGQNNNATITDSYATGSVSGTFDVGGLVGMDISGTVTTSYWNTETTSRGTSGGGTGLTSEQMRQEASLAGIDFGDTWQINELLSFPFLQDYTQDPPPGDVPPEKTTAEVPAGLAGSATVITITVLDSDDNPVEGAADALEVSVSGGPNTGATFTAISDEGDGTYTVSYTPTSSGTDNITITLDDETVSGSPYESLVTVDSADNIALSGPDDVTAGQVSSVFTLTVFDENDEEAPVDKETFFNLSSSGTTFYSDANGNNEITQLRLGNGESSKTFFYSSQSPGNHTIKATWASGDRDIEGESATHDIDVLSAGAGQLDFAQQPTDTQAGEAMSPSVTVRIEDDFGNLISDATTKVTIAIKDNPSGGTLSGTKSRNAVGGIATFNNLSIDKAGSGYTLRTTASGLSGDTSEEITIVAGEDDPGNSIAEVPDGLTGVVTTITITVKDSEGNPVTGADNDLGISVTSGPNTGSSFTSITDNGDGTYSVSYTPANSGNDEITITLDGEAINDSPFSSLVNQGATEPGVPTDLNATAGNMQAALDWQAPADNGGTPITNYLVEYSTNGGASWADAPSGLSVLTSRTVSSLTNNTGHLFRVAAVNEVGTSSFSDVSNLIIPVSPVATPGGSLPVPDPGTGEGYNDGVPFELSFVVNDDGSLQVLANDDTFDLVMTALGLDGLAIPISSLDQVFRLLVDEGASILFTGVGFEPGSHVSVWLFSDPVLLGTLPVDQDGRVEGSLPLPANVSVGAHTLQVNGKSLTGGQRSVSVGVQVGSITAPQVTDSPTIDTQSPFIGAVLTADSGQWTGSPEPDLTLQWLRCESMEQIASECQPIAGETSETYTVVASDLGNSFRIRVTADNGINDPVSAVSASTDPASLGSEGDYTATAIVPDGSAGESTYIIVEIRDDEDSAITGASEYISLSVSSGPNAGATFTPVTDNGDGTYTVSYTPVLTGTDQITVTLDGDPVSGSPFESIIAPMAFTLSQNYPNPFSGSTTIEYEVPTQSKVSLTLYDVLGRPVETVVDEPNHAAGIYEHVWIPRGLASGVYIYRMRAVADGGELFEEVLKMMIVR